MIIYLAGPLFTSAERSWNSLLANNLRTLGFEVRVPQDFCEGKEKLSELCLTNLEESDIIVVNCDGTDVDSGTCMEFGYALKSDKKSIAYRTDIRRAGDCSKNVNLMVAEQATVFLNLPLAGYSEVGRAIAGAIHRWK